MTIKVIKADGTAEPYLHTKVMAAINIALEAADCADVSMAEDLADVVTHYIHKRQNEKNRITSGEILYIIQAVLEGTDNGPAAEALSGYHYLRKLNRSRIEVVDIDAVSFDELEMLWHHHISPGRWEKASIVQYLNEKCGLPIPNARVIASAVEEKVLNMGCGVVSTGLIKQLVLAEAAAFSRAEKQLQALAV